MKALSRAGQNPGHQATAGQLRTGFYSVSAVVAAGGASMFIWPGNWPIGIAFVVGAATLLAIRVPAAPRQQSSAHELALATMGYRPIAACQLDLSDESPSPRSFVEIVPDGIPAPAARRPWRPGRAQFLLTISLIVTNGVTICLLVTHFHELAPWALTIPVTIVAALSMAVIRTRNAQPSRQPGPEPENSTAPEFCFSTTRSRITSHARIKGVGE